MSFLKEELAQLCITSELCPTRFAKNTGQNHTGELAKLDRASNSAQQGIAILSKNSLLREELAELEKSSELCSLRFVKDAGQNHISELAKLDRPHNSA